MSTFTWAPTWGAALTVKPTINKTKFGDGYELRTRSGINMMPRSWNVSFTYSPTVINAIEAFLLETSCITSFDWQPPSGVTGKFVCDEGYSRRIDSPGEETITVVFREVFEQ